MKSKSERNLCRHFADRLDLPKGWRATTSRRLTSKDFSGAYAIH